MGSQEKKMRLSLERRDLPVFFRDLAERLEKGKRLEEISDLLDSFYKLKISIKDERDQFLVKITSKSSERGSRAGSEQGSPKTRKNRAKPKYKDLKKRMKKDFKSLFSMVHEGRTPPRKLVESFLADSELMLTYPGYGDAYYKEYGRACEAFSVAYESGDKIRLHETLDRLDTIRSHCHNRYK